MDIIQDEYQTAVAAQMWPRMICRVVWLIGLLLAPLVWGFVLLVLPLAYYLFYCPSIYRKQMVSVDVVVVGVVFLIVWLAG